MSMSVLTTIKRRACVCTVTKATFNSFPRLELVIPCQQKAAEAGTPAAQRLMCLTATSPGSEEKHKLVTLEFVF